MTNYNNYVKFPMKFPNGLGYSPAAAGPVGGWANSPGPGFYGQPMDSILPKLVGSGSTPANGHFFGSRTPRRLSPGSKLPIKPGRKFGYPLLNRPSSELNEVMFPMYPVGAGNTPGGDGGVWMQSGAVNFNSYWGFGRKKRSRTKSRSRRSRTNSRTKSRTRRSRTKSRRRKSRRSKIT
jgi:hypothetical protein